VSAARVDFGLAGRVAVVTGAGRGIGRAILDALVLEGVRVIAVTRTEGSAAKLVDAVSGTAGIVICGDAAASTTITAVRVALEQVGHLDILVNNAGEVVTRAPVSGWTLEQWDRCLDINLRAAFAFCRELEELLRASDRAAVVNIASLLSFTGGINSVGYAAAKGGLVQLTKALANEWASAGIRVNAIAPGYIETDANADLRSQQVERAAHLTSRIPMGYWGTPTDVAGAVLFMCSDAAGYVTGTVLPVDGGFLAW
jgi:2-deoxy-D-gluconate 3-dehydrogenase